MSGPEFLTPRHGVNQLTKLAESAFRTNDFASAFIAWQMVNQITQSEASWVYMEEAGRCGGLTVTKIDNAGNLIAAVARILGDSGEHLAAHTIYRAEQLDFRVPSCYRNSAVVRKALAHQQIRNPARTSGFGRRRSSERSDWLRLDYASPRLDRNENCILEAGYVAKVRRIQCLSQKVDPQFDDHRVGDIGVLELDHALCFAGSHAIIESSRVLLDVLSRDTARTASTESDPLVDAVDSDTVLVYRSTYYQSEIEVPSGVFLAYPATQAWGHFFNQVLIRVAILGKVFDISALPPLLIKDDVPEVFVQVLLKLFPGATIFRVPQGTAVKCGKLLVVPSWVSCPPYEAWSLDGDLRRTHQEPFSADLMSKVLLDYCGALRATRTRSRRIYLSRKTAKYRRSELDNHLSLLAQSRGFEVVDIGTLDFDEQLRLAVTTKCLAGLYGSNWEVPVALSESGCQSLIIHHDRPHEWAGLAWAYESRTSNQMNALLGHRKTQTLGYGPESYHVGFSLSEPQLNLFCKVLDDFGD